MPRDCNNVDSECSFSTAAALVAVNFVHDKRSEFKLEVIDIRVCTCNSYFKGIE